jgi:hypothetical protein
MSSWITSFSLAALVVMMPLTFILKVLLQLPRPLALSHRRWPMRLNFGLIVAVTVCGAFFIRKVSFDRTSTPAEILAGFLIAALVYGLGLVLLFRQFSGVYAEFVVTTGRTGLGLRKTRYRNIQDIESVAVRGGETRLRIETAAGDSLPLTLPTRYVSIFYSQMRKKIQDG